MTEQPRKELVVSAIENGTVIDHIPSANVFQVMKILGLDKTENQVLFGTNLESRKYGFKGIKSIVKIRLVDTMPVSAWMKANSREYGFYANVNPNVSHPRWSQARERRIGEFRKRETLMFNGYAEQVAHLYQGMDLAKYY